MSPPIPVDIIDEIIDNVHHLDDVKSLHNLALTSHSFLRRSRYHLFSSHVCLKSVNQLNSFCDFLDAHPDRRPWIKSVTISNTKESPSMLEVVPVRLLANLSHLEIWRIVTPYRVLFGDDPKQRRWISSNTPKLTCLRHYAQAITQLHLDCVRFLSCADFARYILAFPGLRRLHCEWLRFQHEDDATALARARERLRKELQLSHLTIEGLPYVAATLLLESAQHTLQEIVVDVTYSSGGGLEFDTTLPTLIPRLSNLSSITLQAQFVGFRRSEPTDDIVQHVVKGIQALASNPDSLITEVVVHLHDNQISKLLSYLQNHSDDLGHICRTLETALLRLPRLQKVELCHDLRRPIHNWTPTRLEQFLPTLHKRGLISTRCLAPPIQSHSGIVIALAVSPDSRWIASGSDDTTIILWDARCGAIVHEWPTRSDSYVRMLAFSRDGRYLASVGGNRKVMVWDVSSATETKLVTTLEDADYCVWAPDGTIRASGGSEGTIQVWNPSTSRAAQLHSLDGYPEKCLLGAILSPDGRWAAAYDEDCSSWKVWDGATGRLHKVLPGIAASESSWNSIFDLAGRRVVIPSGSESAQIWDVETGDELAVLGGYTRELCNVAFSPDGGTRVLSTGPDRVMIRLWDSFSGDILLSFLGHEDEVYDRCFSPDGKYVVSASADHTVRLWNASTGLCVRTFTEHDDIVWCVVFSPDGETLVSGGGDGRVCIRRLCDVCLEECSGDA